jgi:hypothetical protein
MPEPSVPLSAAALCARLDQAQADLAVALDADDTDRLQGLVESREADLVLLSRLVERSPEVKLWAQAYQDRDRELIARLIVARDAAAAKIGALRKAQSIHRAYASAGTR